MLDAHLFELMNNKPKDKKPPTRFELALDEVIKTQVDALMEEAQYTENRLLSPEQRRDKIEEEVRKEIRESDSIAQVSLAVKILLDEGQKFLEKEQYSHLSDNIIQISQKLDALDFNALTTDPIQEAVSLSTECGQSILEIAIIKYDQGLVDESLALFAFLTLVNPKEADYWFRFGLVAEKCEKHPLALSALNTTSALAPEFIGSHIYSAYCHLKMHSKDEALTELDLAKKIAESTPIDAEWKEHINHVQRLMTG